MGAVLTAVARVRAELPTILGIIGIALFAAAGLWLVALSILLAILISLAVRQWMR